MRAWILAAILVDARVLGCLEYGSSRVALADKWSDLNLVLYVEEEALDAFVAGWETWAAQLGTQQREYASPAGHPWAVFEVGGVDVRVDFAFKSIKELGSSGELPPAPADPEDMMVLYDGTGGKLTKVISNHAGKAANPDDLQAFFTRSCADFWTALLRIHGCLLHKQHWEARHTYNSIALDRLMALLRLESGASGGWLGSGTAIGIETAVSKERLAQLSSCIPEAEDRYLPRAMQEAADLGLAVCTALSRVNGWGWPELLAERVTSLIRSDIDFNQQPPLRLKPIGIVENSIDELLSPKMIKAVISRIIVNPEYSAGLEGLAGNQRLLVVFQFHRLAGYELQQHPHNDRRLAKRGVFALHSPRRPNPIGVTEVELVHREGNVLTVRGLDAVNGTPVLDLKLDP